VTGNGPPGRRSRPQAAIPEAADVSQASSNTIPETTDLSRLSIPERRVWLDGYQWGRVCGLEDGFARGYAACDEELSRLQREAHRVVSFLAGIAPWDVAEENRRQPMVDAEQEMERRLDLLRRDRRAEAS
jgi:hypothetical protein